MGLYAFTVVHVHWASRARLAKPILMTAMTMTARTAQPALTVSTTTPVFVPPITQVSRCNTVKIQKQLHSNKISVKKKVGIKKCDYYKKSCKIFCNLARFFALR